MSLAESHGLMKFGKHSFFRANHASLKLLNRISRFSRPSASHVSYGLACVLRPRMCLTASHVPYGLACASLPRVCLTASRVPHGLACASPPRMCLTASHVPYGLACASRPPAPRMPIKLLPFLLSQTTIFARR